MWSHSSEENNYFSPNGFDPNSYCGCLESIFLHELFHLIGYDESYHRAINDMELKCFSCAKYLGPDYDPSYGESDNKL